MTAKPPSQGRPSPCPQGSGRKLASLGCGAETPATLSPGRALLMYQRTTWLHALAKPAGAANSAPVPGLMPVVGDVPGDTDPSQVLVLERAAEYGADYVFFRASSPTQLPVPEALVFLDDGLDDAEFAALHRRLWSWGGVPLVYRRVRGRVDLLRCAHAPDFAGTGGEPRYQAFATLQLLADVDQAVAAEPWWDANLLHSGALWDAPEVCRALLSSDRAAARALVAAITNLDRELDSKRVLPERLRRRLLVLSLLIAYLEDRDVLGPTLFSRCTSGATRFFQVLADGPGLVRLLSALERQFNGDVFCMTADEQAKLQDTRQLGRFAALVEGHTDAAGQSSLWRLYSFRDLPVELISHVYQHFVRADRSAVYTPPFLVRMMLDEALGWARLDSLAHERLAVLDPSCGSGVFLVEAYKRMIAHWRARNDWAAPSVAILRDLLLRVRGVDLNPDAVELTAFSLCLAMCEALDTKTLRSSTKLFPKLRGHSLHTECFFTARAGGLLGDDIGAVLGNPPFESKLSTPGARASYAAYQQAHGKLPDKQVAYLFLSDCLDLLQPGGVLCMLQQYNLLYTIGAASVREHLFRQWDVREVLDMTSIRGLFGAADTKVIAVVIEANPPPPHRQVLHATFRRTGRVVAEQGFDLDYYDLHWPSRAQILADAPVWRSNLVGGGRVVDLVDRLRSMRTLGAYARDRGWDVGQGFIRGGGTRAERPADHIVGRAYLPSQAITPCGLDADQLSVVPEGPIEVPRTPQRFTPPMLLVRLHADLPHHLELQKYLTYPDQVVGFCAPKADTAALRKVQRWLTSAALPLQAYVAATSRKIQKATAVMQTDIEALPYPACASLDLSANEEIVAEDIVHYYRDFLRLGEKSAMYNQCDDKALAAFAATYVRQIESLYPGLRALPAQRWPGAICQPFAFGSADITWDGADNLHAHVLRILGSNAHTGSRSRAGFETRTAPQTGVGSSANAATSADPDATTTVSQAASQSGSRSGDSGHAAISPNHHAGPSFNHNSSPTSAPTNAWPGPVHIQRIARIFDGPLILLLKPDRLRFWLRSVALRDADETVIDLHAQGL